MKAPLQMIVGDAESRRIYRRGRKMQGFVFLSGRFLTHKCAVTRGTGTPLDLHIRCGHMSLIT